ncbi:hypothetical protein LXL04_033751 [Taraxacum kok-saghyz]
MMQLFRSLKTLCNTKKPSTLISKCISFEIALNAALSIWHKSTLTTMWRTCLPNHLEKRASISVNDNILSEMHNTIKIQNQLRVLFHNLSFHFQYDTLPSLTSFLLVHVNLIHIAIIGSFILPSSAHSYCHYRLIHIAIIGSFILPSSAHSHCHHRLIHIAIIGSFVLPLSAHSYCHHRLIHIAIILSYHILHISSNLYIFETRKASDNIRRSTGSETILSSESSLAISKLLRSFVRLLKVSPPDSLAPELLLKLPKPPVPKSAFPKSSSIPRLRYFSAVNPKLGYEPNVFLSSKLASVSSEPVPSEVLFHNLSFHFQYDTLPSLTSFLLVHVNLIHIAIIGSFILPSSAHSYCHYRLIHIAIIGSFILPSSAHSHCHHRLIHIAIIGSFVLPLSAHSYCHHRLIHIAIILSYHILHISSNLYIFETRKASDNIRRSTGSETILSSESSLAISKLLRSFVRLLKVSPPDSLAPELLLKLPKPPVPKSAFPKSSSIPRLRHFSAVNPKLGYEPNVFLSSKLASVSSEPVPSEVLFHNLSFHFQYDTLPSLTSFLLVHVNLIHIAIIGSFILPSSAHSYCHYRLIHIAIIGSFILPSSAHSHCHHRLIHIAIIGSFVLPLSAHSYCHHRLIHIAIILSYHILHISSNLYM